MIGLVELAYFHAIGLCAGSSVEQLRLALRVLYLYEEFVWGKYLSQALLFLDAIDHWQVLLIREIILFHCQV